MSSPIRNLFLVYSMFLAVGSRGVEPITSRTCRGGDGPTPLGVITGEFPQAPEEILTEGTVEDFLLWPSRNDLVYRNQLDELYAQDLQKGSLRRLGVASEKMSRVVDYGERVILLANKTRYLDTNQGYDWQNYVTHFPISNHLYWHWDSIKGDVLYSLASVFITPNVQTMEIYSYTRKMTQATHCELPSQPGEFYHVAKGHAFPYVYLYKSESSEAESTVTFYRVRLESGLIFHPKCEFKKFGPSVRVKGKVKAVQFFKSGKSAAIITDNTLNKVVWANAKNCYRYDLGGREPILIGDGSPIVGTWDKEQGVQLLFLDSRERAEVMKESNQVEVTSEQLLLSEDEKTLLMRVGTDQRMYLKKLR